MKFFGRNFCGIYLSITHRECVFWTTIWLAQKRALRSARWPNRIQRSVISEEIALPTLTMSGQANEYRDTLLRLESKPSGSIAKREFGPIRAEAVWWRCHRHNPL